MKFKKIIAGIMSGICLISGSVFPVTVNAADYKLGDLNNDSKINAVDASETLSEYARTSTNKESEFTETQKQAADVNKDGKINAVDASCILSYYAYRSTGGTVGLEEYLSAPPVTTTKTVTTTTVKTTTTQAVTTTTATQTTQKYAYKLEDITQSAEVFNYFAEQMNNELFRGRGMQLSDFNGERYGFDGKLESKVALLVLNENENYKDGVLKEVFNGYNDEIIKKGVWYFFDAPRIEEACSGYVDFNKYAIDKNVGNYMNKLQEAMKSGDESKNYSEMDKILEDFLYNEQYEDAYYNIAAFYYSLGAGVNYPESSLNGTCWDFTDGGNFYGVQEDLERKVKELIR